MITRFIQAANNVKNLNSGVSCNFLQKIKGVYLFTARLETHLMMNLTSVNNAFFLLGNNEYIYSVIQNYSCL